MDLSLIRTCHVTTSVLDTSSGSYIEIPLFFLLALKYFADQTLTSTFSSSKSLKVPLSVIVFVADVAFDSQPGHIPSCPSGLYAGLWPCVKCIFQISCTCIWNTISPCPSLNWDYLLLSSSSHLSFAIWLCLFLPWHCNQALLAPVLSYHASSIICVFSVPIVSSPSLSCFALFFAETWSLYDRIQLLSESLPKAQSFSRPLSVPFLSESEGRWLVLPHSSSLGEKRINKTRWIWFSNNAADDIRQAEWEGAPMKKEKKKLMRQK